MEDNAKRKFTKRQEKFLSALQDAGGNITAACMKSGIRSRQTIYNWMNNPDFKNEVEVINETSLDYVESKLMTAIQNDNITAIIFYLKTKGKKRGYVETIESQMEENQFERIMKEVDAEDIDK